MVQAQSDILDELMDRAEAAAALAVEGVQIESIDPADPNRTRTLPKRGPVTLYRTADGNAVTVNYHNAVSALKKRHTDPSEPELMGKPVFSTTPTRTPFIGAFKCLLHPDQPEAQRLQAMGFPVCRTAHLPSSIEVEWHMKAKHPRTWEAMERERERRERDEDRARDRAMMDALLGRVDDRVTRPVTDNSANLYTFTADNDEDVKPPLYVSDKPRPAARKPKKRTGKK